MCTATWIISNNGYELFFNRDELKTRLTAVPPIMAVVNRIRYISPVDADAGGTWIAVNEFGFAACLLNYYRQNAGGVDPIQPVSRGHIIYLALSSRTADQALERLGEEDLNRYRPFSLLLFTPGTWPMRLRWKGSGDPEIAETPSMPQSSSSFQTESVVSARKQLQMQQYSASESSTLLRYHRSHEPEKGPFSVCMHREDAETQSFSHISVNPRRVGFSYTPGSPCKTPSTPWIMLQRRAA